MSVVFVLIRDILRLTIGAFGFIYAAIELGKSSSHSAFHDPTASSFVQLFLILSLLFVLGTSVSLIPLVKDMVEKMSVSALSVPESRGTGVSTFYFVLVGLLAGINANKIDAPPSVLTFGGEDPFPALFVSAGVLVAIEWVVDMILEEKDDSKGSEEDAKHARRSALISVIFSFLLLLFGFLLDEQLPLGDDDKYQLVNNTYDVTPNMLDGADPQHGVFVGLLFGGFAAIILFIAQFDIDEERRWNLTGSGLATAAAGSIALELGRHFHSKYYESRLLPTQAWYAFAGLFMLQAARLAAIDKQKLNDLKKETKGERGRFITLALLFTGVVSLVVSGFWFDTYAPVLKSTEGASRGKNHQNEAYSDSEVMKAREFGSYALYLLTFLGVSVVSFKVIELAYSKTLQNLAPLCCKRDADASQSKLSGRVMTHRGEAMLALSLAVALFAGARDPKGAEQMRPEDFTSVWMLWLVLVGAAIARAVSFFDFVQRQRDNSKKDYKRAAEDEEDPLIPKGEEVVSWCFNAEPYKFGDEDSNMLHDIAAVLLIAYSAVAQGITTFRSDTSEYGLHLTAFILTCLHALLVVVGLLTSFGENPFHAGMFPFVRFGVSTSVVVLLSALTGINIVEGGYDQAVVSGLVAYLLFDIIAEEKY